ncbi:MULTISPECIES: hypothetical protein [Enterobacterales]|nr:hypothetical protein [Serratia marcescens]MDP8727611.1 hypothetical protein [Serratia marcescens]HCM9264870.1 hypothetical protein [Enterobacter hormaechei subsp. hoffmannii]HDZ1151654.1 hypothetical protein [Klebsiella pneumoniae]
MNNKILRYWNLSALGLMIFGLLAVAYLIYRKENNGMDIYNYFLLAPPIIISFGLSAFYKRIKPHAELLYAIAATASALTLCLDALPDSTNNLFPYFFQSVLGYLILVWVAALSLANIIYTIAHKILSYFFDISENSPAQ